MSIVQLYQNPLRKSELFGHIKGAFTGATQDRAGKFELANGGTLFLDEVGELPLSVQAKLLRALQVGEIQRVGSDKNHIVDVRIIAATNRDLSEEVREAAFRADLYHRLSVYPLMVPPLRDRVDDIPLLVGHFLQESKIRMDREMIRISSDALNAIQSFNWPGNVRELEHVIMRGALRASAEQSRTAESVIIEEYYLDISTSLKAVSDSNQGTSINLNEETQRFQTKMIKRAVAQADGNWSQAATLLGIDRSNLHRLAKRLGIK